MNFIGRDAAFAEDFSKAFGYNLFAFKGKEGVDIVNRRIAQFFDIVLNVFSVGGYDGAVVMVAPVAAAAQVKSIWICLWISTRSRVSVR